MLNMQKGIIKQATFLRESNPIKLDISIEVAKNKPINNAKYIKLCYNNLELPLKIRNRIAGDYIEALAGTKKISRVFIDNKVPLNERDNVPIILDNSGKILWIYDYIKSKDVYNQKHNGDLYLICEVIYE